MLSTYLWVVCGAILGACARFFCTQLSSRLSQHHGFPFGTLFVNVSGSLLAGFVLAVTSHNDLDDRWRLLLVVGFCGAYTTFSGFAWETMAYLREARFGAMTLNFLLNNALCFAAVLCGIFAAKGFHRAA